MYKKAYELADKARNPRLKANSLNSLAVLQDTNGYKEKSEITMAEVNKICADYNIDLDEDSETSPSQNSRNDVMDEDDAIDLEDLIGDFLCRVGSNQKF